MKNIIKSLLIISCMIVNILYPLYSVAQEFDSDEIKLIVSQISSKDEKMKFKGLGRIITMYPEGFVVRKKYRSVPEIRDAVFDALVYYSSKPESNIILCGDGSTYVCLLGVIGDFNDLRTLPYLLDNMSAGVTVRSLAQLGKPALEPVLKKLEGGKAYEKRKAARVLGRMVEEKAEGFIAKGEDREKIKKELLTELAELADKDNIKIHVVNALGKFKDKDLLPIFEKIAKEDMNVRKRKDRSGKIITRYPVREAAKKAIEKLKQ